MKDKIYDLGLLGDIMKAEGERRDGMVRLGYRETRMSVCCIKELTYTTCTKAEQGKGKIKESWDSCPRWP